MKILIALLSSLILFSSCCKEFCTDTPLVFNFKGFTGGKKDTINITSFGNNGLFTDTVLTLKYEFLHNPAYQFAIETGYSFDYEMIVASTGKRYRLSEIETKTEDCRCDGGRFKTVESYKLNGIPFQAASVDLEK